MDGWTGCSAAMMLWERNCLGGLGGFVVAFLFSMLQGILNDEE
jgi:hypothetical protein